MNCIKIQTISVVSKYIYFGRDSLCFIYFGVIIRQQLKKKFRLVEFYFSRANKIKTCGLVQQLILGMLSDLILQSHNFQSLDGIHLYVLAKNMGVCCVSPADFSTENSVTLVKTPQKFNKLPKPFLS